MMPKIFVISIGNEILLGKTVNTNLADIGDTLFKNGYEISASTTIQDNPETIKNTLKRAWSEYDIIISTGGLGPTKDDRTRDSIASVFGKSLKLNKEFWHKLKEQRQQNFQKPLAAQKSLAKVPEDFVQLKNKVGTAPGLQYSANGKHFFAMPGVPAEMKFILEDSVIPFLKKNVPGKQRFVKTIRTACMREIDLHEELSNIEDTEESKIAFLPKPGLVDIRIVSSNKEELKNLINRIQEKVGQYIYGYDDETLQHICHKKLIENKKTLSVAESCTGGLIQNWFTDNPGSSNYFLGGVVSYSNFAKKKFLDVKQKTLDKHGAVSHETVKEMLQGAKDKFDADLSLAVSGIAGPAGGTKEKPVGLVYVGVLVNDKVDIKKCNFNGNRLQIKQQSAITALYMLHKNLENLHK